MHANDMLKEGCVRPVFQLKLRLARFIFQRFDQASGNPKPVPPNLPTRKKRKRSDGTEKAGQKEQGQKQIGMQSFLEQT